MYICMSFDMYNDVLDVYFTYVPSIPSSNPRVPPEKSNFSKSLGVSSGYELIVAHYELIVAHN